MSSDSVSKDGRRESINARQYDKSEWRSKEPLIRRYYIHENMTLPKVMKVMAEDHNFHATRKMYVSRLEGWGLLKNFTEKRVLKLVKPGTRGDTTYSLSRLKGDGQQGNAHKMKQYLKRTKKAIGKLVATDEILENHVDEMCCDISEVKLSSSDSDNDSSSVNVEASTDSGASEQDVYETLCPYQPEMKRFRIIETFSSGLVYEADSIGFREYLASDEDRPCSELCYCRRHVLSKDFSFVVQKSPEEMQITIHSLDLYIYIMQLPGLEDIHHGAEGYGKPVDGLVLLKHYDELGNRTGALRTQSVNTSSAHDLLLECELLVDGLLGDAQVFKSYGYEMLYERGFINFKIWKKWQETYFGKTVSALNQDFCEIDDDEQVISVGQDEAHPKISQSVSSPTIMGEPTSTSKQPIQPVAHSAASVLPPHETYLCNVQQNVTSFHNQEIEQPNPLLSAAAEGNIELVQQLLNCGFNIYGKSFLHLPLTAAAKAGHEAIVHLLLDRGADVDGGLISSNPLVEAAQEGHEGLVRLLLDRGASIEGGEFHDFSPLARAARGGHEGVVRLLLDRGARVDGRYLSLAPLAEAAQGGHEEIVRLLLDRGAPIEGGEFHDFSPLAGAARGGHEDIVRLLLDRGAPIEGGEFQYFSPLTGAAQGGHEEIVWLLLDRGAPVGGGKIYNFSSLAGAAQGDHAEILRLLSDRGTYADGGIYSLSPLARAAKEGHEGVVLLLLDRGAFVDGYRTDRQRPIYYAAEQGHEEIVKLLLDHGASLNWNHGQVNYRFMRTGDCTIFDADEAGQMRGFQLLLAREASFDSNELSRTTISMVLRSAFGNISFVRSVLKSGTNINTKTHVGTALSAAAIEDKILTMRWLLRHGADVDAAVSILQGNRDTRSKVTGLLKAVALEQNGHLRKQRGMRTSNNKENNHKLRTLRRAFVDQHALMIDKAKSSSTRFSNLAYSFGNHRAAWEAGIKAMRGLGHGERPEMADTIAFLCLAKAISETLDSMGDYDYTKQFFRDLPRWQLIFDEEEDRLAYRDAVQSMWWWIVLDDIPSSEGEGSDCDTLLDDFYSLVSVLIGQVDESFNLQVQNERGFESNQEGWKWRNGDNPLNSESSKDVIQFPSSEQNSPPPPMEVPLPKPPDPDPEPAPLQVLEDAKMEGSIIDPAVVLLMCGAIFAIVLIFLQWLQTISSNLSGILLLGMSITTLQDRYRVLQRYLGIKPCSTKSKDIPSSAVCEADGIGDFFDFGAYENSS